MDALDVFRDLSYGLATALASDKDCGIDDQSHAEWSAGLRLRTISRTSAAKSSSITGSQPRSSVRALVEAMISERRRPGPAVAGLRTATGCDWDSMMISSPARTRAINPAKSFAASVSEMWIVAMTR